MHGDKSLAALAVWAYKVPDGTMHHVVWLGRDSWMRFKSRKYRALPRIREGRIVAGLTLTHVNDVGVNFFENDLYFVDTDDRFHLVSQGDCLIEYNDLVLKSNTKLGYCTTTPFKI